MQLYAPNYGQVAVFLGTWDIRGFGCDMKQVAVVADITESFEIFVVVFSLRLRLFNLWTIWSFATWLWSRGRIIVA